MKKALPILLTLICLNSKNVQASSSFEEISTDKIAFESTVTQDNEEKFPDSAFSISDLVSGEDFVSFKLELEIPEGWSVQSNETTDNKVPMSIVLNNDSSDKKMTTTTEGELVVDFPKGHEKEVDAGSAQEKHNVYSGQTEFQIRINNSNEVNTIKIDYLACKTGVCEKKQQTIMINKNQHESDD